MRERSGAAPPAAGGWGGRSGSAAAVGSPALAYGAAAAAGRPLPFALIWFWGGGESFPLCNEGYAKIIIYICRERERTQPQSTATLPLPFCQRRASPN